MPDQDHAPAEHAWPESYVLSRALVVNKQVWLTWKDEVRKSDVNTAEEMQLHIMH